MSSLGIVYGEIFATGHKPWRPHPEHPVRLRKALRAIARYGLKNVVEWFKPVKADIKDLEVVHAKGYIDYIVNLVSKAPAEIDPDTYVVKDSLETALYAFGSAIYYSLDSIEKKNNYILLVRPPGHHTGIGGKACGAPTQGFCLFNNVAGAAKTILNNGYEGVVILDIDVHHGNGTQEIFYKHDKVLFISIHQDPKSLYPFNSGYIDEIGEGRGKGYNINIPLPPMAGDDCYNKALEFAINLIKEYDPQIILVSAGFDGYKGDGMAELMLSSNTYHNIGIKLRELGKPVVSILEGGYGPGLEYGLPAFVAGLLGMKNPVLDRETKSLPLTCSDVERVLSELIKVVRNLWGIA